MSAPRKRVYVVSYPKSGRTWLRAIIGTYLVKRYGLPKHLTLEVQQLTPLAGVHPTIFTHDGSEWIAGTPPRIKPNLSYENMSTDKSQYSNAGVILMNRCPYDTLVSSYFQATERDKVFVGSISDFVRSKEFGIMRILKFYNTWEDNQHVPERMMRISYEDLYSTPISIVQKVLSFIGESNPQVSLIEKSVSLCSFDKLKLAEQNDEFNSPRLRPTTEANPESYKVRRGKIGGYVDYLVPADIDFIANMIEEVKDASIKYD